MPAYEMSVIFKVMDRLGTSSALKRVIHAVSQNGGIVRNVENIGQRRLPYSMARHSVNHRDGIYMLFNFNSPVATLRPVKEILSEDLDVIRSKTLRKEVELGRPCQTKHCHFGELTEEARFHIHTCIGGFQVNYFVNFQKPFWSDFVY